MSTTVKAASRNSTPTTKNAPRGVRKDIGMLMFLLAAETAVVSTITDSPSSILSGASTGETGDKNGMTFITGSSETSSRNGETDSSSRTPTPEEEEEILVELGASGRHATKLVVFDGIMSIVLSYIPWKEVGTKLRGVNKAWLRASETIVQIRPLPGTLTNAAFFPCPKNLDQDKETEAELQFVHPSTWRCVVCGFWNAETRVLCGNRQCQCPSLTHAGCARIFLGQLRRDATVPFIQWLVSRVLEAPGELRNVENHRHNVTNRGKGCAWAYFKTDDVAQQLLSFHRRMFLDTVDGNEGLWIVQEKDVEVLHTVASERGYAPQRPKCLPRNALVVEPPATGSSQMGRELLSSNLNIECQYAEAESPVSPAAVPPTTREQTETARSPVTGGHARTASTGAESAVSVTNSEYRHNPYGYSPAGMGGQPAYQWPSAQGGAAAAKSNSTCGDESSCLPSASAPPAYDDVAFATAPYYSSDNSYGATYYNNVPNNYGYDNNATYSYY